MRTLAPAKINLALVVGPRRPDGKHEVVTVLQRLDLGDHISLERTPGLEVRGYQDDTLVRDALLALARAAQTEPHWVVEIEKWIPVAAGLGGGSSDAAAALKLANATLVHPLPLQTIAAGLGADVPFFLTEGAQLGTGDGSTLEPLDLPQDYVVLLILPVGERKVSTGDVYAAFRGAEGFDGRREALLAAVNKGDLGALPPNDLAFSPLAGELRAAGAFRADVTGAGPTVYGLFANRDRAVAARDLLADRGEIWLTTPAC